MKQLYIYTLFEKNGRPRYTGINAGGKIQIYELFKFGAKKTIATIERHKSLIKNLIITANDRGVEIVTSDFKSYLSVFNLPLHTRRYNVYDLHLPDFFLSPDSNSEIDVIKQVLDRMVKTKVKPYQNILANSAVVYHDLQCRGLLNNYDPVYPVWSLKTFSGRSKASVFPIQGYTEPHKITPPGFDNVVFLHFDWICADIRVASILSHDTQLSDSYVDSDPYTHMMNIINNNSNSTITRDECKILLLKSINSMDFNSVPLSKIYTTLGDWIIKCSKITSSQDGFLDSILQRRFKVANAKSNLAVLNGIMQGSVAHGMQNVIRKVWEKISRKIVAEIHDSLVVVSTPDVNDIKATIDLVANIMLYPFAGILDSNPVFPLKVSVGTRWKQWDLKYIYRENGVECV